LVLNSKKDHSSVIGCSVEASSTRTSRALV